MKRIRLGSWCCSSGNSVDAFLSLDAADRGLLTLAWDAPPPFSPADQVDYEQEILPAVVQRVREYLEIVGPAMVVAP
jgi:hypothetical protein